MKTKSKLLKSFISISFIVSSVFLLSINVSAKDLTKGDIATTDIINAYYPKFKVGSKWIYNSKTTMNNMNVANFDVTSQITKETGDTFTVKSTAPGMDLLETVKKKDFSPIGSSNPRLKKIVYKYNGKENITIPSGSYSGADKFTGSNINVWFVKGKGAVKSEVKSTTSGMAINSVVSLKSFTY